MAEGAGPTPERAAEAAAEPAADPAGDRVAAAMLAAMGALQRQDPRAALEHLAAVPEVRVAPEAGDLAGDAGSTGTVTAGVLARANAWRAQAAMDLGRYDEATRSLRLALRQLRALGDAEGLAALAPLQQDLFARRAAVASQGPLPDTPLGRALAAMDAGDWARGEALALEAAAAADAEADPREQVMARLALARVPGRAEAAIHEAAALADASDDRNLVTAVARAARAADVVLAPHVF